MKGLRTWLTPARVMATDVTAAKQATVLANRAAGRRLLGVAALVLLAMSVPVIIRGAPLADDFHNCLAPQDKGLLGFMSESFERLGVIRPARFVEILLTTGVCQNLPFGVAIAVGVSATFVVALLLRRLLTMLGSPAPWPDLAAAAWLLQPLGLEAALWPAALHVPIGLAAALASLIAHRSRRLWAGALLAAIAMLSVEQTILALPLAAWLVSPTDRRRAVSIGMTGLAIAVVVAYLLFPGNDPRLSAGAAARVRSVFTDLAFLARYLAGGVGAESIPIAVRWALPLSILVLVAGVVVGWRLGARVSALAPERTPRVNRQAVVGAMVLILLINVPVLLSQPRQGSPRIFTPTWLLLCVLAALWLGRLRRGHNKIGGAVAGFYVGGAILSLALSSWVRVETADVVEHVAHQIAARTTDGDLVALCDVPRSAVIPAPRGAFAVQDYLYDWAAGDVLRYYTGRLATFHIHQANSPEACPVGDATLVSSFDALRERND